MPTIGELKYRITATNSQFVSTVTASQKKLRDLGQTVQRNTTTMRNWSAGISLALFGLKKLSDGIVSVASDAQETQSKFNTVFKGMAKETNAWANQFSKDVGRAKQDVKAWMAELQDTFVPLGFARDEAADLSKSLVKLGVDVASFNNESDDEVIRNFTSALVGNHEAVRSYGIVITQAAIEQEMLRQGIQGSFLDLDELTKAQLRYNIILRSTTDAQGDAIRTADEHANKEKRLAGRIKDMKSLIGTGLIPIYDALQDKQLGVVNGIIDWIQKNRATAAQILVLGSIVTGFVATLGILAGGAFITGQAIVALTTIFSVLSSPIFLAIAAIAALYVAWESNVGGMRDATTAMWAKVKPILDTIIGWEKKVISSTWNWLITSLDTLNWMYDEFIGWLQGLPATFRNTWNLIVEGLGKVIEAAGYAVEKSVQWLLTLARAGWNLLTGIIDAGKYFVGKAVEWSVTAAKYAWGIITDLAGAIGYFVAKGVEWAVTFAKYAWNILRDITGAMGYFVAKAVTWTVTLATTAWNLLKDITVAADEFIVRAVEWSVKIVKRAWGLLGDIIEAGGVFVGKAVDWVVRIVRDGWNLLQGIIDASVHFVVRAVTWTVSLTRQGWDLLAGIVSAIGYFVEKSVQWLVTVARAGWNLISDLADKAVLFVGKSVEWLVTVARDGWNYVDTIINVGKAFVDKAVKWVVQIVDVTANAASKAAQVVLGWIESDAEAAIPVDGKVELQAGEATESEKKSWGQFLEKKRQQLINWMNTEDPNTVSFVVSGVLDIANWVVGSVAAAGTIGLIKEIWKRVGSPLLGWFKGIPSVIAVPVLLLQLAKQVKWNADNLDIPYLETSLYNQARSLAASAGVLATGMLASVAGLSSIGAIPLAVAAALTYAAFLVDWSFVGARIANMWESFKTWYADKEKQYGWKPGEFGIITFGIQLLLDILGIDVNWGDAVKKIDEKVYKPIRQMLGTEPTDESKEFQDFMLKSKDERNKATAALRDSMGPTQISAQDPWWVVWAKRFGLIKTDAPRVSQNIDQMATSTNGLADAAERLEQITQMKGASAFLFSLRQAEGNPNFGMTDFIKKGNQFGKDVNNEYFKNLIEQTGFEEGTTEYYMAAAATSLHWYWQTFKEQFPEAAETTLAELSPELKDKFIEHIGSAFAPPDADELNKNWQPNMKKLFTRLADDMKRYGVDSITEFVKGVREGSIKSEDTATQAFYTLMSRWIHDIAANDRAMLTWGADAAGYATSGIIEGAQKNESKVRAAFERIRQIIQTVVMKLPENVRMPILNGLNQMDALVERVEKSLQTLGVAQDKIDELLGKTGDKATTVAEQIEEAFKRVGVTMASSFEGALSRLIAGTATTKEFLASIYESIRDSIADLIAKSVVAWVKAEATKRTAALVTQGVVTTANTVMQASNVTLIAGIIAYAKTAFTTLLTGLQAVLAVLATNPFLTVLALAGLVAIANAFRRLNKIAAPGDDGGDDDGDGGGDKTKTTAGNVITYVSGRTRDALVNALRPLNNLNQLTAYLDRLVVINTNIRDLMATNLEAVSLAGAGGITLNMYIDEISESYTMANALEDVETYLGGQITLKQRGRGRINNA